MEEGDTVVIRCTSYITQSLKKATQQYILKNRLANSEVFLHAKKKFNTRYHNPPTYQTLIDVNPFFPKTNKNFPKIFKPNQPFVKPSSPMATFAFPRTHTHRNTKLRGRFFR